MTLHLQAQSEEDKEKGKIEVTAKFLTATKTTVKASEDVFVYYDDSVIKSSSATYNKETKLLVLDGNVEMIGYQGTKEHTNHMEIQTDTKEVQLDRLFLTSKNDVWLLSDKAHRSEGNYTLGRSILSSCDVSNPLWKMVFAHSMYDSEAKYMKVYDAKLYFWDIPIFYSPYLAFSTNNERSSGLLFPLLGYNAKEGFVYEQPIFWNLGPSMDIEFNPQIRTNRSLGLYSTFRFVDSQYSSGELRAGYFKDKSDYVAQYNLPEESHYGLEFNYVSSNVLRKYLPNGYNDGLYINTTYLNDIDYLNLQKTHLRHFGLIPLQESRLNYYLYNDVHYTGVNAKYFIDTRENVNKDETVQILPSIQWHKYLNHFLWKNLTYSIDTHINNYDRKEGSTLKQAEVKIPLEFTGSFFDDLLHVSIGEEFYYSKFFFGNGQYAEDDFQYYSNIHKIRLFTDLTKKYIQYIHVLQPSLEYIKPGNESEKPVDFDALSRTQKELFSVGLPEEHYAFSLSQYFYDETMKLKFFQRLSQKYYPNRAYALADLSNEMQYNWKQWQFYSNMDYAHEFGKVRESSSRISLQKSVYNFTLGHTYKQQLSDDTKTRPANDINFNFGYKWNERVRLYGGLTYDIDESTSRQWRIGGTYAQDCWNMTASIRQDIIPRPVGFTTENSFYVQFNFVPFGGVGTGEE